MSQLSDVTADLRHFQDGYRLGYGAGYDIGFAHGADDAYARVQSALTGCTDSWRSPRQDDLRAARDESITTPCRSRCKSCSKCIRYAAWWRNGQRDFTGVPTWNAAAAVAS